MYKTTYAINSYFNSWPQIVTLIALRIITADSFDAKAFKSKMMLSIKIVIEMNIYCHCLKEF
jgi:hypothetical protein